jgi:ubiquinone/menaquinone biosynthesis C-methylase UbiE
MNWWSEQVVPRLTDRALDNAQVAEQRAGICAGLSGSVLEIGFGSGLNVPHYPVGVTSVTAVEPSDVAWRKASTRVAAQSIPVFRGGLDGQRLEADDGSYDAVLSTFTLCTIPDVAAALGEVARVLRPGGTFHFLEHGLAPDANVQRWQVRLEPMQRRVFAGRHLTRAVDDLVADSGLVIDGVRSGYAPGPAVSRPWNAGYTGVAHKPA